MRGAYIEKEMVNVAEAIISCPTSANRRIVKFIEFCFNFSTAQSEIDVIKITNSHNHIACAPFANLVEQKI